MTVVIRILLLCAALSMSVACTINPVTGKREIALVGEASEIQLGEQNYAPMQQSQGGEYDIDPELTGYVRGVGTRLAAVSDRPLPYEFVVLNNSVPNAWALPGGKIAINRGLLTELDSEAELAAVLGHEIVHAAARHSAQRMEQGMLLQGLVLATAVATSDSDYGTMAVGGANLAAQLVTQRYGRSDELEADLYGMQYMAEAGYDPQGAVDLQETFVRLSEGRRSDWLSGLFASHPPSQARVDANRRTAAMLPTGGELGADRYRRVLEKTEAALPAYAAYDEGRKALADRNTALAVDKAEQAIQRLPEEAHFYALRGDARLLDQRYDMAITNYDSAISRRDDFFYYYLQRGRAHEKVGNEDAAVRDLETSLSLLPTAAAHNELGTIAARRGDRTAAMQHFQVVADGQGEVAEQARQSMVRLDIDANPGNYVQLRCAAGNDGDLLVSVRNATSLPLSAVVVAVAFRDNAGRERRVERRVGGTLAPGQIANVATGLGPYTPAAGCPAQVVAARVAR